MKYLMYAVFLVGFFAVQAENAPEREVFNPMEEKTRVCQQLEEVKKKGSCEGTDCPPLYEGDVVKFLPLQWGAVYACSFRCVVGERICDETLHPDYGHGGYITHRASCAISSDEDPDSFDVVRNESVDDKGMRRIEEIRTYEDGCTEHIDYVEVCSTDEGGERKCREIEVYSDEWYEYERELQLAAYEESCFVPTKEDCQNIELEMQQCVVDMANLFSEYLCTPSTSNLWKYRKYGPLELFIHRKSYYRTKNNIDLDNMKMEDSVQVNEPVIAEEDEKQGG